jgi:hypothetical protein
MPVALEQFVKQLADSGVIARSGVPNRVMRFRLDLRGRLAGQFGDSFCHSSEREKS